MGRRAGVIMSIVGVFLTCQPHCQRLFKLYSAGNDLNGHYEYVMLLPPLRFSAMISNVDKV